MHFKNTKT